MLVQAPEILEIMEMVETLEMVPTAMVELDTPETRASVDWVVAAAAAVVAVPVSKVQICPGEVDIVDMKVAMPTDQVAMVVEILLADILDQVATAQALQDPKVVTDLMDLMDPPETPVLLMLEIWDMLIPETLETPEILEILEILEIQGILEMMEVLEI